MYTWSIECHHGRLFFFQIFRHKVSLINSRQPSHSQIPNKPHACPFKKEELYLFVFQIVLVFIFSTKTQSVHSAQEETIKGDATKNLPKFLRLKSLNLRYFYVQKWENRTSIYISHMHRLYMVRYVSKCNVM